MLHAAVVYPVSPRSQLGALFLRRKLTGTMLHADLLKWLPGDCGRWTLVSATDVCLRVSFTALTRFLISVQGYGEVKLVQPQGLWVLLIPLPPPLSLSPPPLPGCKPPLGFVLEEPPAPSPSNLWHSKKSIEHEFNDSWMIKCYLYLRAAF